MTPYGHTSNDTLVCIVGVISTLAWYVGFHRGFHLGEKRARKESAERLEAIRSAMDAVTLN